MVTVRTLPLPRQQKAELASFCMYSVLLKYRWKHTSPPRHRHPRKGSRKSQKQRSRQRKSRLWTGGFRASPTPHLHPTDCHRPPHRPEQTKPKRKSNFGAVVLSTALQEFLGEETMSRPQITKALWVYIKGHDLQVGMTDMQLADVIFVLFSVLIIP